MSKGQISDGFHTFDELYDHRHALFGALSKELNGWKSKVHEDGTMFEGWFIAGVILPTGAITYHLPIDLFDDFPAIEFEKAPEWDGHTADDVVKRIKDYWKN